MKHMKYMKELILACLLFLTVGVGLHSQVPAHAADPLKYVNWTAGQYKAKFSPRLIGGSMQRFNLLFFGRNCDEVVMFDDESIKMVTLHFHFSRSELLRKCREKFGVSPYRFRGQFAWIFGDILVFIPVLDGVAATGSMLAFSPKPDRGITSI